MGGATLVGLRVESAIGSLTVVGDASACVALLLPGEARASSPPWRLLSTAAGGPAWLGVAVAELRSYFAGRLRRFTVRLAPRGSPFDLAAWLALAEIAYGQTWSYGGLARRLGRPGAARAVGGAVGRNPLPILLPCHRVVGADGRLTGYGGGLPAKAALLALEGALDPAGRARPEGVGRGKTEPTGREGPDRSGAAGPDGTGLARREAAPHPTPRRRPGGAGAAELA